MATKAKRTTKFPPEEVEFLIMVAQKRELDTIPEQFTWIKELDSIVARNILLDRFQSLKASLMEVVLKGKYWTSYSKTLLKLFGAKGDLQATANMLKKTLSFYTKDELWHTGEIAVILAIKECKTNLSSAIVFQFKDLIQRMVEDRNKTSPGLEIVESYADPSDFTSEIEFDQLMESLTYDQWVVANSLINNIPIPEHMLKRINIDDVKRSLRYILTEYRGY